MKMATAISNTGCWTCRLRRKKCDNKMPQCFTCECRGITCFGFGSKPRWMDKGPLQKAMTEQIKKMLRDGNTRLRDINCDAQRLPPQKGLNADAGVTLSSVTVGSPPYIHLNGIEGSDPQLSYYLTHVFPLHFRYCHRLFGTEGLAWLQDLMRETKPLYHAVLSLSAYHYDMIVSNQQRDSESDISQNLRLQYSRAVRELREYIAVPCDHSKANSLRTYMKTLACIILLVSFELFQGGTENWQIHLKAAVTLIPLLKYGCASSENSFEDLRLLSSTDRRDNSRISESVREELTVRERIALDFFSTALIWFDTLSCVTTGLQPAFAEYKSVLGSTHGSIRFDRTVGCENWVVVIIVEVSGLSEWKSAQKKQGTFSMLELSYKAAKLECSLKNGMAKSLDSIEAVVGPSPILPILAFDRVPHLFLDLRTYIFASSVLVYLYATVSGASPEVPEVQEGVFRTTAFIQRYQMQDPALVQSIVWPFFILGCLSTEDNLEALRDIVLTAELQMHTSATLTEALILVEDYWRIRRSKIESRETLDFTEIMQETGTSLLLL